MKNMVFSLFAVAIIGFAFLQCSETHPFTVIPGSIYPVDAVTSASREIRIDSGSAYSTYAILTTYHKDSYDRHVVKYGVNGTYTDSVHVAAFPRIQVCTLVNLLPNTVYSFDFIADFKNGTIPEEFHHVTGSFATPPQ